MNEAEVAAGLARTPKYLYTRRVGNQLFVAGQVPRNADGELVGPGDARAQAAQCLKNLELLLSVHGFALADVRRLVVYVAGEHAHLLAAWNVVTAWFSDQVPPATLLGVARLGYEGQLVEIDATVVREP